MIKSKMDRFKQFLTFVFKDKNFFIFWLIALITLAFFGYLSGSADLWSAYAVRVGLLIAIINLILALLAVKRIQLLAILFCWNTIIASILSIVYIYKALL